LTGGEVGGYDFPSPLIHTLAKSYLQLFRPATQLHNSFVSVATIILECFTKRIHKNIKRMDLYPVSTFCSSKHDCISKIMAMVDKIVNVAGN
jgi:hypothetical protein